MASGDLNFSVVNIAATILVGWTVYFFGKALFSKLNKWFSPEKGPLLLTECPPDIQKLNDTVYELYAPNNKLPEVEIVFFHGLQLGDFEHAYWKSWLSRDGSKVWPKEWLSEEFPNARILTISYDSCAKKTLKAGQGDMYNLGENLLGKLILNNRANVGQNCPVILVGHSLGCLAIKQFILSSHLRKNEMDRERFSNEFKRIDQFLSNFRSVLYYSPTHAGSRLADLANLLPTSGIITDTLSTINQVAERLPTPSPVLSFLTTLNANTARINSEFRTLRQMHRIQAFTVAESLPTQYKGFNTMVVVEASAREDTDRFVTEPVDHFNICKPKDTNSIIFQTLEDLVLETLSVEGTVTQNHLETFSLA